MNQPRDPDAIIATWLDDGPIELPDETRRAIAVGLRTQPRPRRVAILGGSSMTPLNRLIAAAAIVLALGGLSAFVAIGSGFSLLGTHGSAPVGVASTPTPTTTPAITKGPTPTPLDSPAWRPFKSTINGFSARFPSDWTVKPATRPGDLNSIVGAPEGANRGAPDARVFDVAVSQADQVEISSVSMRLPRGMTPDEWLAAYRQPFVYQSGDPCFPTRDKWEAVVVDGEDGGLYHGCEWYALWYRSPSPSPDSGTRHYFESMLFVQGRVYIFQVNLGGLSRFTTWQDFVQSRPADEETRQLLRAFLKTVTFDTANAKNP